MPYFPKCHHCKLMALDCLSLLGWVYKAVLKHLPNSQARVALDREVSQGDNRLDDQVKAWLNKVRS